jgi:hypothetical protein
MTTLATQGEIGGVVTHQVTGADLERDGERDTIS